MKLKDKVALVTGASSGIGQAVAIELAKNGADIVINYCRSSEGAKKTSEEIKQIGSRFLLVRADVTKDNQIKAMVKQTIDEFGKIDILVNNAGTIYPVNFLKITETDWDFIQNVDVRGLAMCTKNIAPYMIKRKYGKIINISSDVSFGVYLPGFASYSAAKAAVNNFTKYSARELGKFGINVNAVAPGEIITALTYKDQKREDVERKLKDSKKNTMLKKLGNVNDVANLVLFLASDESSFITGEIISVDGGRIDRM